MAMKLGALISAVVILVSHSSTDFEHGNVESSRLAGQTASLNGQAWRLHDRRLEESSTSEKKEGEGAEKEKGEVEGKDDVSLAVSVVLMVTVAFIAAAFYLTNHRDKNIKQYTHDLLSDTMSIFCAVAFYQGMDALFDEQPTDDDSQSARIAIEFVHFLAWYVGIQAVAIGMCESTTFGYTSFKAICGLGAHLSGFAAKGMFNSLMQSKPFNENVGMAIVSVLISAAVIVAVCLMSFAVRRLLVYPKMRESQAEKCKEEIIEVENDMISLSMGFIISQVLRFAIHGKLPTEELDEQDGHEQWEAAVLLVLAVVFGLIAFAFVKVQLIVKPKPDTYVKRLIDLAKTTNVFVMAWCLLFWGQWEVMDTHFTKHLVLARIVLAAGLSVGAFLLIFLLDFIADRAKSPWMKKGDRLICSGLGLTVAFAWEATFDFAVESVADNEEDISESAFKLILAIVLVLIVSPAWAWYVLPKTSEFEPEGEEVEKQISREESAASMSNNADGEAVKKFAPADSTSSAASQPQSSEPEMTAVVPIAPSEAKSEMVTSEKVTTDKVEPLVAEDVPGSVLEDVDAPSGPPPVDSKAAW
jgi:hypothetical protein